MISRLLRIDTQLAHNAMEIIIAVVFDGNASTLFGMVNDHACGQASRQKILQVLECGESVGSPETVRFVEGFPSRTSC